MFRIAINGYGRIGRCLLRALYEARSLYPELQVVAINELADLDKVLHLTRYDSTHGRFPGQVGADSDGLLIDGERIQVLQQADASQLPWSELAIDLVLECSGAYHSREHAELHLGAGAGRVLFSQPADPDVDATIVYGTNEEILRPQHRIVSNASCTTNAIIPVLQCLEQTFGIDCAQITTIHSAMHDQPVIDAYDSDLRKTRSALASIIPVETGLARGVERILPELKGRVCAQAIRVPTTNVSVMDLSARVSEPCDVVEVNDAMRKLAQHHNGRIVGFNEDLLVSCDFNHDPRSSIVDANQTQVCNKHLVKLMTWFDNEWGFANRMLDTAEAMRRLG